MPPRMFAGLPASVVFPWWMWGAFFALVVFVLAADLGAFRLFRRKGAAPARLASGAPTKQAAPVAPLVLALVFAVAFGVFLLFSQGEHGAEIAGTFAAGYLMELALSVDNLFVFLLVFSAFRIPHAQQHRVLFWGVLGAVVLRAVFIFCGVTLLEKFSWLMAVFGGVLIATAVKMLWPKKEEPSIERNVFVRIARRVLPIKTDTPDAAPELQERRFLFRDGAGKLWGTPLFLALIAVEGSDVVFAADSIPAVMGILPPRMPYDAKLFIAFTSNIFAILGLRSLFFVLSGFLKAFWLLEYGLATILGFIGVKMILTCFLPDFHLSPAISLGVLAIILTATIALSLTLRRPASRSE